MTRRIPFLRCFRSLFGWFHVIRYASVYSCTGKIYLVLFVSYFLVFGFPNKRMCWQAGQIGIYKTNTVQQERGFFSMLTF